jgi:hypothetical protein
MIKTTSVLQMSFFVSCLFIAGPPQDRKAPVGDKTGHGAVPADCSMPVESVRLASRDAGSKLRKR